MKINVKELLGDKINVEDAIILRDYIENNLDGNVELDFNGIDRVSTTFLTCLFTDIINKVGRDNIISKINVKNLSNYTDYSRVVAGTTFA
ncbi:STAS-like domain-containing protein [Clostridium sp. LIBA-8841]|uniref:STAS-like domain-containing protein n=1 Tax=Clostridium sp. LIBA-8841 TaxID=2987530 RepID=UPI002AC6FDE6|nr:STAS-like domain-containing protein [Clostridium sp. LIBA-8841]MDZ5254756.1 STAS-like domain-containing protein [Clostridium sp. LIBA-8841]